MRQSDRLREAGACAAESKVQDTVLHVLDHSFPIADGYAFRSAEILRFQHVSGWQTVHITSAKQGPTQTSFETVDGFEFYRTQPSKHPLYVLPVLDQLGIVTTLRRNLEHLVRHRRPAILHVHSPCLNGLAALSVARHFALPIIYEIRSLWEDAAVDSGACREGGLRYRGSRALETYVCRRVDQVVTICEGLRAEIVSRGLDPDRVTVAPNSVDLKRFTREGSRDDSEAIRLGLTAGKTFGFIGTFFPFEGLELLIRAVSSIRAREPQVRFLLVGDGPEEARLRALARELGVEDAIVFTGRVDHAEIERYYDLIDVLVYPRESKRLTELVTPLKPLEAMARRKLIVASDVGGHREMVFPGENGLLFRAGDQDSLAETCLEMLNRSKDWDAFREQGFRYVRESRSWLCNVLIYDRLYRRLISERATA